MLYLFKSTKFRPAKSRAVYCKLFIRTSLHYAANKVCHLKRWHSYTVFEAQILTENSYAFVFPFMFPLLTAQRRYFDRVLFSVRDKEWKEEFWRDIKLRSARRSVCRLYSFIMYRAVVAFNCSHMKYLSVPKQSLERVSPTYLALVTIGGLLALPSCLERVQIFMPTASL